MDASTAQLIRDLLERFLLYGGLVVAAKLLYREYRQRPDRAALTAALSARSWSLPQILLPFATLYALFIAAGAVGQFFQAVPEWLPMVRLITTYVVYGIPLVLVAVILRKRGTTWSEGMGMGRPQLNGLYLAPILYLAAIPFIMIGAAGWHELLNLVSGSEVELQEAAKVAAQAGWSPLKIAYILGAVLFAPLYEEILFRGVLFPWLSKHAGLAWGIAANALLFATMHQNSAAFIPLALLAAALCLAYWRTQSLWACIGVHALFNTVSIFVLNISG